MTDNRPPEVLTGEATEHTPHYETYMGETSVWCRCGGFFRIGESEEVAEAEHANHVDLNTMRRP